MVRATWTAAERLGQRVQYGAPDECWPFLGPKMSSGYGIVWMPKHRPVGAHRVSWEVANGPIPIGMDVCHHCDNPPCCNPDHLFLGTAADNLRDMAAKRRHPMYIDPAKWGIRYRGEQNGSHRLTTQDVLQIRDKLAAGHSGRALAREFGVDKSTIYAIRTRETWQWL